MPPTAADNAREWHCNVCVAARPQKRDAPACTCRCYLCQLAQRIESAQQRADRARRIWVEVVRSGMR